MYMHVQSNKRNTQATQCNYVHVCTQYPILYSTVMMWNGRLLSWQKAIVVAGGVSVVDIKQHTTLHTNMVEVTHT